MHSYHKSRTINPIPFTMSEKFTKALALKAGILFLLPVLPLSCLAVHVWSTRWCCNRPPTFQLLLKKHHASQHPGSVTPQSLLSFSPFLSCQLKAKATNKSHQNRRGSSSNDSCAIKHSHKFASTPLSKSTGDKRHVEGFDWLPGVGCCVSQTGGMV